MNAPSALLSARWMAIWLPRLSTDRLRRAGAAAPDRPLALYTQSGNAYVLASVDKAAAQAGLAPGMALADARAMRLDVLALAADAAADAALLDAIGAWCERFTPSVACDGCDGLWLDIGGSAHLFGGEAALLTALPARLRAQGFAARAAIAPTPGAAWALARYASGSSVESDRLREALAPLPVEALRLPGEASALLKRLGLYRIGQILDAPRAPFAARAGQGAMLRLDQALGRASEAVTPRRPPPPVFALRCLLEPVFSIEAVLIVARNLCDELCERLDARGMGALLLRLSLFGVDNKTRRLDLGLSRPERASAPMLRLLREKLSASPESLDAEFGFEALRLDAVEIAPPVLHNTDLTPSAAPRDLEAEARLHDRLAARLGAKTIGTLRERAAHAPERASLWAHGEPPAGVMIAPPQDGVMRRPLSLFAPPQPIEAMASVPDGPPIRFRWRRVLREIARAEGPERIEADWLQAPHAQARDYYRVEDNQGRRYWIYREGLYGQGEPPRWYVHGLFA